MQAEGMQCRCSLCAVHSFGKHAACMHRLRGANFSHESMVSRMSDFVDKHSCINLKANFHLMD